MEEKNIKGEYLNLSPVDNQENLKFNLISHDKKYYDFRRKYFDIFLITIIVIIFFIILLLRPILHQMKLITIKIMKIRIIQKILK